LLQTVQADLAAIGTSMANARWPTKPAKFWEEKSSGRIGRESDQALDFCSWRVFDANGALMSENKLVRKGKRFGNVTIGLTGPQSKFP
jgi:hypothetical protein